MRGCGGPPHALSTAEWENGKPDEDGEKNREFKTSSMRFQDHALGPQALAWHDVLRMARTVA